MDIQILHSWLSEYIQTNASPQEIGRCLALCGPSVEKVEQYGENDWLYSIEVTTNRVDMMSVYGIAREAAVILPQFGYDAKLKELPIIKSITTSKSSITLSIKTDSMLTNRVMAQVMQIEKIPQTPQWMKDRLEAAQVRSLNLLVDITNYVMLEVGHPTHVFDYDRITTHKLLFRPSKKGEKVTTLDEKTYILAGGDSVIDDGTGQIIDLPGIMGTANSVVTDDTKTIIFFIDNNNPKIMRKTSMQHGIRTNAVTLNEKHVSPELAELAMKRGILLYKELCGAKPVAKLIDIYDTKPKTMSITVSFPFIEERLGVALNPKFVKRTLDGLGFSSNLVKITSSKPATYEVKRSPSKSDNLQLTTPYWRANDINIPEDIVEEVARIYGYYKLPSVLPTGEIPVPNPLQSQFEWEQKLKYALKHWGFYESYSYSLVSKDLIEPYGLDLKDHLKLKNPLTTDWEYMRTTLIPSILSNIELNQNKTNSLKMFELANTYIPRTGNLPKESLQLTLATIGNSYYDLKGIVEGLCNELGIEATYDISEHDLSQWFEQGKAVTIKVAGKQVGYLGQIKVSHQSTAKISSPVIIADIDFETLIKNASKNKTYTPIPKYPSIVEQYTFINESKVPAATILQTARSTDTLVHTVEIVDVFENKLSLEVSYLDRNKNLSDEEVSVIRKKLVNGIEKLGMQLQGTV